MCMPSKQNHLWADAWLGCLVIAEALTEWLVPRSEPESRALVEDGGLMLSRPRVGCVSRLQPRGASAALGGSAVCVPHLRMCVHFTCDQAVGPDLSRMSPVLLPKLRCTLILFHHTD